MTSTSESVVEQRTAAVATTMARIGDLVQESGINRGTLEEIKQVLIDLAMQTGLFPKAHYPVPATGKGFIYRLFDDLDAGLALYASAGVPGKYQPPHNHTTWAAIAAVYGDEHNVMYERTDNGATPGHGSLRRSGEVIVSPGTGVALMPDDFHTIEVTSAEPSLHLHVYGRSLERLPGRIFFQTPDSTTYATFPANPNIRTPVVTPAALRSLILSDAELALLDVREERAYSEEHLLTATSTPLSTLELRIAALVPARKTTIVLCDGGGDLANRAATLLARQGYRNLSVLDGGVNGWKRAGYAVYAGMHVPSKAFGEFVEDKEKTPSIQAEDLAGQLAAGEHWTVIDCRPREEYARGTLPGAINCPGVEVLTGVLDAVSSSSTRVAVHCAGRTRGILAAQTLLDGGIPNPVHVLEDGTMGWHLAGHDLEEGRTKIASFPSTGARRDGGAASAAIGRRGQVRYLDEASLLAMQEEASRHTLYLVDVRSSEEYVTGHRRGALSIPGGQLLQATESYLAVRNARIVLTDDDGIRATITAAWLNRMGYPHVYVLGAPRHADWLETGPEPRSVLGLGHYRVAWVRADALAEALADGADGIEVIDLAPGPQHLSGHIPGARFAARDGLAAVLNAMPRRGLTVLTSEDGVLASMVAAEIDATVTGDVQVLLGGTRAWQAAGHSLASGDEGALSPMNDVYQKPYHRAGGREDAMQAYLAWEKGLLRAIHDAGDDELLPFLRED